MGVNFIINILNLDKIIFFDLKNFIHDLQIESRNNKDYCFTDFNYAVERELYKKRLFKSKYYSFIQDYKDMIIQLKNKDLLLDITYYILLNKEKKIFEFLDYLYNNYDYKDLMLENLKKLHMLEINEFKFVSKLEDNIMVYENTKGIYELNSVYTDGKQKWYKYKKGYLVLIENHNFIIKYNKNSDRGLAKLELFLKSLVFDSRYLPNYDELYSLNKWQFIDKESIERKTNIIDKGKKLEEYNYKLVDLYNKLLIDVEELSELPIHKDVLIKISDNLEIIQLLEKLKLELFKQNEDIISIEEFNKVKKM